MSASEKLCYITYFRKINVFFLKSLHPVVVVRFLQMKISYAGYRFLEDESDFYAVSFRCLFQLFVKDSGYAAYEMHGKLFGTVGQDVSFEESPEAIRKDTVDVGVRAVCGQKWCE